MHGHMTQWFVSPISIAVNIAFAAGVSAQRSMPSDKIKSRDLSYESNLPPFLQRLHDQKAGRGDADKHERPIARPKRVKTGDDDDAPTVVDESGETLSKEEYERLAKDGDVEGTVTGELKDEAEALASGAIPDEDEAVDVKKDVTRKTVGVIGQKKRKAAKVVGDEQENDQGQQQAPTKAAKKKKSKPIKLTFDNAEDG